MSSIESITVSFDSALVRSVSARSRSSTLSSRIPLASLSILFSSLANLSTAGLSSLRRVSYSDFNSFNF